MRFRRGTFLKGLSVTTGVTIGLVLWRLGDARGLGWTLLWSLVSWVSLVALSFVTAVVAPIFDPGDRANRRTKARVD